MFGFKVEGEYKRYWGARAIFQPYTNHPVDLLGDRQGYANKTGEAEPQEDVNSFFYWVNNRALPELNRLLKESGMGRESGEVITIKEFNFELHASPQRSHGYLYIGAVEREVTEESSTDKLRTYVCGEDRACWSSTEPLPRPGDKITVNTGWGKNSGTVVGYGVESSFIFAFVKFDKPNPKWIEHLYNLEVEKVERDIKKQYVERWGELRVSMMKEMERDVKYRLTNTLKLLPKTAGKKKVAESCVYWAAGVDMIPQPVKV